MSDVKAAHGSSIIVRDDVSIIQIAARRGAEAALQAKAADLLGLELPAASRAVERDDKIVVWSGPGQWLVIHDNVGGSDPFPPVKRGFAGLASTVDVSDSRVVVTVAGPSARDALSRVVPIDLHERGFPPGSAAITQCFHLGVTLWRPLQRDEFTLTCARTYADDFLRHLGDALGVKASAE